MKRKLKSLVVLSLVFCLFMSSTALGYLYSGIKWPTTTIYDRYLSNLPSSWQTPVGAAAATWNSYSNFKIYKDLGGTSGNSWGAASLGSGTVGITYYYGSGTTLSQCLSYYNNQYSFSTNPNSSQYDLQSVALHEYGHWLRLLDLYNTLYDSDKVMYGYIDPGQIKRSLTQDDINGIRAIYGY